MNLDEIKKRLDKLNNKGGGGSNDFKNNFWRPPVGEKSVVRIVPYAHNKDFPFSELYFYFGIGKPRMIALSNFDESDPILEFATTLKKSGDKENRIITILEGNGWKFQFDEELPIEMTKGKSISIEKGRLHRVIKGNGPLKIKLQKNIL